jgi:tetratricopeptide (TPR) repeat protein
MPCAEYCYLVQRTNALQYKNVRIQPNAACHNVGTTHEYLHVPHGQCFRTIDASQWFIEDVGDGGCKDDKFARDIALLHRTLEYDPTNASALFYLANSYMDIGQYPEAITHYQKRLECGGWSDEQYIAAHRMGRCWLKLDKEAEATAAFVSACRHSPCRLESLHDSDSPCTRCTS